MGLPVSPLHPPRDVQDGLRDGDANALKEHDQVVVAPGGAEALVASMWVPGDVPAGSYVRVDARRSTRCSRLPARPGTGWWASQPGTVKECRRSSPSGRALRSGAAPPT
ncbi:hypothetical protein GCM10010415_65860 [Streptomyces atrovirens]